MKIRDGLKQAFVGVFAIAILATARAQSLAPDEFVSVARAAAAQEPITEKTVPVWSLEAIGLSGTYWMLQTDTPPLPYNPFPELPVVAVTTNIFLVDDRSVDYPALTAAQAAWVAEAALLRQVERAAGLMTLESSSAPPSPGEGGGGGTNEPPVFEPPSFLSSTGLCLYPPVFTSSNTLLLVITNGVAGAPHDLYTTTNLSPTVEGLNLTNWLWLARSAPGQSNFVVVDLPWPEAYYVLGTTNGADAGAFPDAYEKLVSHGSVTNASDDVKPEVSVAAVDSVANESGSGNTARFVVSRSGATNYALAVGLQLSGTASYLTDYTLSGMTTNPAPMGRAVVLPVGVASVELMLTALADSVPEGSETATVSVAADWPFYAVSETEGSATAWIVEGYSKTYTTVEDFHEGTRAGLEAVLGSGNGQLQFQSDLPAQFPFINVACSGRGTVARINTTNGVVVGEYRTTPAGLIYTGDSGAGPQPSRTTVDQYGNVWVANRADDQRVWDGTNGSITRIGLILGGTRHVKTNGVYVPDDRGQYVSLSNATYNTCVDRDGDGFIRTSAGLADILPWTNQRNGRSDVDTDGGVSTAEDEAITEYVRVACTRTRTIAVDRWNDIWVGGTGAGRKHQKVSGLTGSPVPNSAFSPQVGGYGGVMDGAGVLWSSQEGGVLRLPPPSSLPPTNWLALFPPVPPYGIAVDPVHPRIWQTGGSPYSSGEVVFCWLTNGWAVTNGDGTLKTWPHGNYRSQGLTVDGNGHIWVAHGPDSTTVGHLDTNGTYLGKVLLRLVGLRAEYFANTNADGTPVYTRADGPVDFDWGSGSPHPLVPTNYFSAKWTGRVQGGGNDYCTFYVSADAGAGFRLSVGNSVVIDNWDTPNPNPVELSGVTWLSSEDNELALEYKELTGDARVRLSWIRPGTATKEAVPRDRLDGADLGQQPTGVSVDALGNIWAANLTSGDAMRINPNAGPAVVTNGATYHLGEVDLVVKLGDGSGHEPPYNVAAAPYNYSDMTGFNNRIVNPGGQPLKGYWAIVHDCGIAGQWWRQVAWTDNLPLAGCGIEVQVRAGDDRQVLVNQRFTPASNGGAVTGVKGRFIEVRVALTRDDASQQPVLYDLTLHAASSGFEGEVFLDDWGAYETEDAYFVANVIGPEPMTYQWFIQYPWTNQWATVPNATGPELVLTNVDLWDDWTWVSVTVSNAAGETLTLGPAALWVWPLAMRLPGSGTSGPAERYPATIHVRGEPTNGLARVEVTLHNLTHYYPSDLDILLVSPSGAKIMLMSDAGSSFGVTNATLVFHPGWQNWPEPPESSEIPSSQESHYKASNVGEQETQLPGAPAGPYSTDLAELETTDSNPNGVWKLYIHDDKAGQTGVLQDSWSVKFYY